MSLDVYLTMSNTVPRTGSGIYIRENGATKEISAEEWNTRFPERVPVVMIDREESNTVYSANITQNLNTMAEKAGIYKHLWRPDEIGVTKAEQLIAPLREGLERLKSNPSLYEALNPSNGWGDYSGLVGFVAGYLSACEQYPEAEVNVSR